MEIIFEDNKKRQIIGREEISIPVKTSGLYLLEVSARAQNKLQLNGSHDENLRIEFTGTQFPFNSSLAFNGSKLKGFLQSIFILVKLRPGINTLSLISELSATIENIKVSLIDNDDSKIELGLQKQAEDADRRPWLVFGLVNLSLKSFLVDLILKRRFIDSDDVKIIVDGKIFRNNRSLKHKLWYFAASILSGERQKETFNCDFTSGTHILEFEADRAPKFNSIVFFGVKEITTEEIKEKIRVKARELNLNQELILRLVTKESDFYPAALSPVGAKGLFQLTDITIKQIHKLGFIIIDPFDVDQNINGGLLYFQWLQELYKGQQDQLEKTLAAWNWGMANFPVEGPFDFERAPKETRDFIDFILQR